MIANSFWRRVRLISVLAGLLLLSMGIAMSAVATAVNHNGANLLSANTKVYLPLITRVTPFEPQTDTQLGPGSYTFSTFVIPDNVTVATTGNVFIHVLQDALIAGNLTGDCSAIALLANGDVNITGVVNNECSDEEAEPGDLSIYANGGVMTISATAALQTSGDLDLGNAPDLEDWEFDVLPQHRATMPMAPVCSAQADSLVGTVLSNDDAEVAFFAEGVDPNGGPVTYQWDFGDGATSAERDPVHNYDEWGVYDVILTVTGGDGQSCQAVLRLVMDDGEENIPDSPAVAIDAVDLVAAVGQPVNFSGLADHPEGNELTFDWDFGDTLLAGLRSVDTPAPSHSYSSSGRYEVSLTVVDTNGESAMATAAVYVYDEAAPTLLQQAPAQNCLAPPPGANVLIVVRDGGVARPGRNGRQMRLRFRGNVYLDAGTDIKAQDGGPGNDEAGSGAIYGGRGGRGGSLQISVAGRLTVCGGTTLAAGNGGDGGSAESNTPAPGYAYARGGNGGRAARLLRIAATQSLTFDSPFGLPIIIKPGNAGDGGRAEAEGGDGDPDCNIGKPGARARAIGGNGGKASKTVIVRGMVGGLGNIEIQSGQGGHGGDALAVAGDGGAAVCDTFAQGGLGRPATARGGNGGDATLTNVPAGMGVSPDAFTAGNGGEATADGGQGGQAIASPPGGVTAIGGAAGRATASGGLGAVGRQDGDGGDATARGGTGGEARATAEDGGPCEDGKDATAVGGRGGNARAIKGRARGSGADGAAEATAGNGGHALATGGDGGDCPVCPAGKGGDGGPATATGGNGGHATGNGIRTGGNGGDGDALGGRGGDGADCCEKFNEMPGGDGGKGGDATSNAGAPGTPGGGVGANRLRGGDGGDGGDGWGPGSGGAGGTGTGVPDDIPDGEDGEDGEECPPWVIWFIYHSTIPDGPIIPGTEYDLDTYDESQSEITGSVPTRFMTGVELAELDFPMPEVFYQKMGDDVFIGQGGIRYDLDGIVDGFPVISVEFTINSECGPECILLLGFYQGELIGMALNNGEPGMETIILPEPHHYGSTAPYYDGFAIVTFGPLIFDHWWVIIIDP